MTSTAQERLQSRRRRQRRVRAKVYGTSARPRLNVYRSLTNIYAQVINDDAGRTLVSASNIDKMLAGQLDFNGKSKIEVAKMVGKALAERAQAAGITEVVFDRGGYRYHGRVKALAEGAREGGLKF
jgi:large subunit ribosomal protein L18